MESLTIYQKTDLHADTSVPDAHQDTYSKVILGFWMYLMTDCLLFTTLFATYAVLKNATFGGPGPKELFHLNISFIETMILLFSSMTAGFCMLSAIKNKITPVLLWMGITFILGSLFVAIELHEFKNLIDEGNGFQRSAFLSSFFTLVGTHGLHVTIGLFWMLVMMFQVFLKGITTVTFRRLAVFNMFWHFLDLIWIFIFTFVYLFGLA